jgi:hypothetical protein
MKHPISVSIKPAAAHMGVPWHQLVTIQLSENFKPSG